MTYIRNVSKEMEIKVEQEIQVFYEKLDHAYQTTELKIHNISHHVINFLIEVEVNTDNTLYCMESSIKNIHETMTNSKRNLTNCITIAMNGLKLVTNDIFDELNFLNKGYLDVKRLAKQCWGEKNNTLLLMDCIIIGVS